MGSSRSTRNAQRATVGGEIVAVSVGSFLPAGVIPVKFAQMIGSYGMFFRQRDSSKRDRSLHLFEAVLATTQLIIASALFFENKTCESNSKEPMCVASFWMMLIYHGTLLTGWGASELLRKPFPDASSAGGSTAAEDGSVQNIVLAPHAPITPRAPSMPTSRNEAFSSGQVHPHPIHQDAALNSPIAPAARKKHSLHKNSIVLVVEPAEDRVVTIPESVPGDDPLNHSRSSEASPLSTPT